MTYSRTLFQRSIFRLFALALFLPVLFGMPLYSPGQTAKTSLENASYYESNGELDKAMLEYYFAADKNAKYFTEAYDAFGTVAVKYYTQLYSQMDNFSSSQELVDTLVGTRDFILQWQTWWNNQKEYSRGYASQKVEEFLPDFETYYKQYIKAQNHFFERINYSSSYSVLNINIQEFIDFRNAERSLWSVYQFAEIGNEGQKVEIRGTLGFDEAQRKTIDQKMYALGCPAANNEYASANGQLTAKKYREALTSVNNAIEISKKCNCNDPRLEPLKEKIMNEGKMDILVMPLRGSDQNGIISERFADLVAEKIQAKNDIFLHALGRTEYEKVLFNLGMDVEQKINLSPVDLARFAHTLDIEYVLIPTITYYDNGNEGLQRNPSTAYYIQSQEGKYFAEQPVPYFKVTGKRTSLYKMELKLYPTRQDLGQPYSDLMEYTEDMDIEFYEGCDYANCNPSKIACCYSSSRPNPLDWKNKFKANKNFPPIQNTLANAREKFASGISARIINYFK